MLGPAGLESNDELPAGLVARREPAVPRAIRFVINPLPLESIMRDITRTPENRAGLTPIFVTIRDWCAVASMCRSSTYQAIGRGDLKTVKVGRRVLIDREHGLAWLRSLPAAQVATPAPRRGSAAQ